MADERKEDKSKEQLEEANKKQAALDAANVMDTKPPGVAAETNQTSEFEDVDDQKKTNDATPKPKKEKEKTDFTSIEGVNLTIKNLLGLAQACAEIREQLYKRFKESLKLKEKSQSLKDKANDSMKAIEDAFDKRLDNLEGQTDERDDEVTAYEEERWKKTSDELMDDELMDDIIVDELIQREEIEESEIIAAEPPPPSPAQVIKEFEKNPVVQLYAKVAEQRNGTSNTSTPGQEPVNENNNNPQQKI